MVFLVMERASSHEVRISVFMYYYRSLMISLSLSLSYAKGEVLIKAIGPRVCLGLIIAYVVSDGPLNPYILGKPGFVF